MSNIAPKPLHVVVVKDELLDFIEPVYTINGPSSLKSFNAQDIQTYSNSYVNATLNLNSTDFVADPAILHDQPITFTVTGSWSGGEKILQDNSFALRSNALYKGVNTLELKLGSTGNTTNVGDVMSIIERFNNYHYDKFINNYGLAYLDNTQDYNDLLGSSKSPLGMFSSGTDIIEPRGSYPVVVSTNNTTTAVISTTLRMLVPISPLVDKIRRDGSPVTGLSHLSNISFNTTFYANMGNRMLSLPHINSAGSTLTVSNISVSVGQPTYSFVQLKCRNEAIPRVLAYPLVSQERYVFEKTLPAPVLSASPPTVSPTVINIASFNLTRAPHSMLLGVRPSNNALLNSPSGVFIPDTFAKLDHLTVQYDGQTLFAQSIPENLYSIAVQSGLSDTFAQWSGLPLLKSVTPTNASYFFGSGSVCKFDFGRDISLYPDVVVGSYNECAISLQVTATNLSPFTTDFEVYMIMLYSDVIELYDNNLAQISNIPVSSADIMNSRSSQYTHREIVRRPDMTGAGLFSSLSNIVRHPSLIGVVDGVKELLGTKAGKAIRTAVKSHLRSNGHNKIANALEAVGFGDMEGGRRRKRSKTPKRRNMRGRGDMEGAGYDDMYGGAYASPQDMSESLLID